MWTHWAAGVSFILLGYAVGAQVSPMAPPPDKLSFPQKRGAVLDEIRRYQSLGRVVVTPNGDYVLYEWQRPYDWSPSNTGLAAPAAARKQTLLYKVNASFDRMKRFQKTTSEFLFYPAPGATYYLGNLSPDSKYISFFEVDRNDNTMRAGIVPLNDDVSPQITWLVPTPDSSYLDQPPVWISNEELMYTIRDHGSSSIARVNAKTGRLESCNDCSRNSLLMGSTAEGGSAQNGDAPADKDGMPSGAKLIAQSQNGRLSVFSVDTSNELSLIFRLVEPSSDTIVFTLFRNSRG